MADENWYEGGLGALFTVVLALILFPTVAGWIGREFGRGSGAVFIIGIMLIVWRKIRFFSDDL